MAYTIDLFKNVNVSDDIKLRALEFINRYKIGQFIYPNVIIRNLKLPKDSISWIIQSLIDNDLVEEMRYYRCPRCSCSTVSFSKEEYEQLEEFYCDRCDEEINLEDWSIIYKLK